MKNGSSFASPFNNINSQRIMKKTIVTLLAAIVLGGTFEANAQIMKAADLEKYAKSRYGDKWVDAAMTLAGDKIGRAHV